MSINIYQSRLQIILPDVVFNIKHFLHDIVIFNIFSVEILLPTLWIIIILYKFYTS